MVSDEHIALPRVYGGGNVPRPNLYPSRTKPVYECTESGGKFGSLSLAVSPHVE